MKIQPIGEHVIVKTLPFQDVTKSGIVLPDTVDKDRPEQGEVVAVGPGKVLENGQRGPMDVAIGQKVVFKKYAPDEIKIEGEKYLVIRMDDIMAVIE
ncbi:MAG: 10 kDa chaperonin [Candidatus Uhrbacteria bacterium GW2011_GWF2_41_16]|uniref:Co-chaperonin GroES n=2 Tax=Candidatus Uhriibacteriota TaxID=1752732 RepID=A0A0G0VB72_9BACT|nr:MAG: 10 kDa chaperonin [Candidatus Uhrbacteria bacterium GW2011_GWA2_41_10]KKR87245.1 MAG: 10 kDa chaperonin [Candidatus Uhrbacteria bacterium GW2011_GWC2_41_11]KKR98163.1 MAG: 10 kDa chaperonin [Candidatus Uhrbacteria bacterium GW2011_GWF2_41_16]HBO99870.1 co-chaperone GroES [Candidatus Uhrbacteria bacterium]